MRYLWFTVVAGCGWLCLVAVPAVAQSEAPPPPASTAIEELPDIEVTVARVRQRPADVTAPVDIVRPEQVVTPAATAVADTLSRVPSLDLRPAGTDGGITGFSLRGAKAEQVLVLIDGRRLSTAQGAGVDLGDLPLHSVERIEVLRGGASAMYGTDAIGGVINIITRHGGDGRLKATVRGGSFGALGGVLNAGGTTGRATWRWDAEYYTQDGDFRFRHRGWQRRANNRLQRAGLSGAGSYDFGRAGVLRAGADLYRAKRGVPGLIEFPTPGAWQTDDRHGVWLQHGVELTSGLRLDSHLTWLDSERDYVDLLNTFGVDSHHDNRQFAAGTQAHFAVAGANQATVGLDWRRDELRSNTAGGHHRITVGLFGQYEIGLGRVRLVPSARVDWQTQQRAVLTPRLASTWQVSPSVRARASWGQAFRAPSFDDLYWPADNLAVGNPNLGSERSTEWNFGVSWQPWARGNLELDYFNRDLSQMIVWQPIGGGRWSPTNVGRVRFQGLELAAETPLPHVPRLVFTASYAYLKATTHTGSQAEIGRQLVGRPFHQASASLNWRGATWDAGLDLTSSSSRYLTTANTDSLPGFVTADLRGRWRVSALDELSIELRNVLNHQYQTVDGYPLPGRELRVAYQRTF